MNPTEFGVFTTSSIMDSVVSGNVFFYLFRFFVRIIIGCSRILYFKVGVHRAVHLQAVKKQTEDTSAPAPAPKLSSFYKVSTLLKLFIFNHFPKVLLGMVVVICFVEEDIMVYTLFTLLLVRLARSPHA